ncbi:Yip1 family protein [Marimonas sp. MJW-29]|uniref:Yip1 family protein n=1 Tax=Sulfitobacter sediminis TaxID=3234186 RepID=A0ABV3RSJ3_9RHOB
MAETLVPLIQTSIRAPREAARTVLDMGLSRDVLWTALALVAVINTFLIYFVIEISGPTVPLPGYFQRPLALFVLIAGLTVVYVHAMYWAGLAIGGRGSLMDVLALVVWFQVLRALAQVVVIVTSFLIPPLGALLSLAVAIWGFWIFLNFLATALNLSSPWHAFAVLVISFVGLVLGLGILMALVAGLSQGVVS